MKGDAEQTGRVDGPIKIGFASARANTIPMFVLWALAGGLVAAYYLIPGAQALFEPFSAWQKNHWLSAAFLNRVVFCGILPGIFLVAVPALRPKRLVAVLLAETLWSGLFGIVTDSFYRFQAGVFGDNTSWLTLFEKLCVDQLLFAPFFFVPLNATFYFWLGRDLSFSRARAEWPRNFFRNVWAPNFIPNICVWVPSTVAIYAMPQPLQLQFSGVISAFWILMLLQIGLRSGMKGK